MIKSVLDLLWKQEQERPEQTALADENGEVTYRAYASDVRKIGGFLLEHVTYGVIRKPVAGLIDRNLRSI